MVGVKSSEACRPDRAEKALIRRRRRQTSLILRGEHDISRKTIAQGMSGCPRLYLYARVRFLHIFAHETAGAASTRHSLRPLISGRMILENLGRIAPRDRGVVSQMSPALLNWNNSHVLLTTSIASLILQDGLLNPRP